MNEENNISFWLALLRAPHVSVRAFNKIIEFFPDLCEFFNLNQKQYETLNFHPQTISYLKAPNWKEVDKDMLWAQNSHHYIVTITSLDYPSLLKETPSPPPVLFIKGNKKTLNSAQVAIIGSRSPSPGGKKIAFELAANLGQAGLIITSGLAIGIDTSAHLGGLQNNQTLAVVGTGLNLCYPKQNEKLAEKICQQGALISEFPCDTPPHAYNFPRRNRLISGLSVGTIVVEANLKSGSLITAGYALEQGREVFAVPGSIYNPRARGCHFLLKQGATLVENFQDVLDVLTNLPQDLHFKAHKTANLPQKTLEDHHLKLLECVGYEPTKVDILVERSHYSIPKVTSIMADLELAGYVSSTVGGYMRVS